MTAAMKATQIMAKEILKIMAVVNISSYSKNAKVMFYS